MNKIILLFFLISFCLKGLGQKNKIAISKTPNWVKEIKNDKSQNNRGEINSGYYYNLIDFQIDVDNESSFSHYTIEIINNEGIQQVSDISIDFDPSYQKLLLHHVDIIRDGNLINKLTFDDIKTVQRETNMERFLYDGTITAILNLTDVRKGDFIDYSYTIIGFNPIYENKYHNKIYFQYSIPIGHLYNRIKISKNRKLNFKYFNNLIQVKSQKNDDFTEYVWQNRDVKPIIYDTNTPSWYNPLPSVSISEYDSWKEVIDQYSKHYLLNKFDQRKLKKEALKLFSNTPKDSLLNEIRKFVQDDIRYLGFEGGINSHTPTNPVKVLQKRYGDCKAKSFLLVEILRSFDFEANPVLVNSYTGKNIEKELPSPNLFNHCIVQLTKNDQDYYIDPTIGNQGGNIETLFVPDYKTGLILNSKEKELSKIDYIPRSKVRITEEFDIDKVGETGYLFITTKYTGLFADDQRVIFATNSIEKIQQNYLNFYSSTHPSIREFSKIELIDHRENTNELIVKESYFIDSLWTESTENKNILVSEFYPLNLEGYVNLSKSPRRTMPYFVQYPVDFEQKIIINLPENWAVKNEKTKIEDNSFQYENDINYTPRKITLRHAYKTLKSYVSPNETNAFVTKHQKILNGLSYQLTYNKNFIPGNMQYSWLLVSFAIIILIISSFFAIKIYTNYNLQQKFTTNSPKQIGGWLVLIAIGLILTPFKLLLDIYKNSENFFGITTWDYIIKDQKNISELAYSLLILVELVYNSVYFVFSILLIVLFFKRRTIFPTLIIIFYALTFSFLTLDSIVATCLKDTLYLDLDSTQTFKEVVTSLIKAAIWIPYFILSKRVKTTFTQLYKQ